MRRLTFYLLLPGSSEGFAYTMYTLRDSQAGRKGRHGSVLFPPFRRDFEGGGGTEAKERGWRMLKACVHSRSATSQASRPWSL